MLNTESIKKSQVRGCNVETVCTFTHDINDNNSDRDKNEGKIVGSRALFDRVPTVWCVLNETKAQY